MRYLFILIMVMGGYEATRASTTEHCVLNYNFSSHPISKNLRKRLPKDMSITYVEEAVPANLLDCALAGAKTITMVVHSYKESGTPQLAYMQRLQGKKADEYYAFKHQFYTMWLAQLTKKKDRQYIEKQIEDLDKAKREGNLTDGVKPFLPRVFERLEQIMSSRKDKLRLRIMVCDEESIVERYEGLEALSHGNNVELEFANKSGILSFLMGKDVTSYSYAWVEKAWVN